MAQAAAQATDEALSRVKGIIGEDPSIHVQTATVTRVVLDAKEDK